VQASIAGQGIALLLLASELSGLEGDFDGRRVTRRVAAVAAVFLAAFSYGNPEQWVVNRDAERYRATGKIDVQFLSNLSLNAAPSVVAFASELPPECIQYIRERYRQAYGMPPHEGISPAWYEWNYRRMRGLEAVQIALSMPATGPEAAACDRRPPRR
jgi:hypothetical protein